jgi:hypothetical protein
MINELNRGHPLRRTARSQAAGYGKRGDKQIDRPRVLEVRIHLPPAASRVRTRSPESGPGPSLRGFLRVANVPLQEFPPVLIKAVLSTEDRAAVLSQP